MATVPNSTNVRVLLTTSWIWRTCSPSGGSGAAGGGRRLDGGRVNVWLRSGPGAMLSSPASRLDELLSDTIGVRFRCGGAARVLPTAGRRYIDKIGIRSRILDKEHTQSIDICIVSVLQVPVGRLWRLDHVLLTKPELHSSIVAVLRVSRPEFLPVHTLTLVFHDDDKPAGIGAVFRIDAAKNVAVSYSIFMDASWRRCPFCHNRFRHFSTQIQCVTDFKLTH